MAEITFRLTLDQPYVFNTVPAYRQAVHCSDFSEESDSFIRTWRCPATGLVMLRPSFDTRENGANFRQLEDFRYESSRWEAVKRAFVDQGGLMSWIRPQSGPPQDLAVDIALKVILANLEKNDTLQWALESKFVLSADSAWAIHVHGLEDELTNKENWFAFCLDNLYVHFSQNGTVRVYRWADRAKREDDPVLVHQFNIASPGDLLNRMNYFMFIPIPGVGIACYNALVSQKIEGKVSNEFQGASRAHIIPWPTRKVGGYNRLLEESKFWFALNPYQGHVVGFQEVTFAEDGVYVDAIHDPTIYTGPVDPTVPPGTGLYDTIEPSILEAVVLPTGDFTVTTTLRNAKNDNNWDPATDRQFRVQVEMFSDDDGKHTPFLYDYGVFWEPRFTTRNTTPVTLFPQRVEWHDDALGRFEGEVEFFAHSSAEIAIAARGDATFLLEESYDDGVTWNRLAFGFAKEFDLTMVWDEPNTYYRVNCHLYDMRERLRELHNASDQDRSAYDGFSVPDAVSSVLMCAGFAPLASVPAALAAIKVPDIPDVKAWRFAPKTGDNAEEVIDKLLFMARQQNSEWIILFDADSNVWFPLRRPRPLTPSFHLVPFITQTNHAANRFQYVELKVSPQPPECNQFIIRSETEAGNNNKALQTAPVRNLPSVTNPLHPDFLGRAITKVYFADEGATQKDLDLIALRVEEFAAHSATPTKVKLPYYVPALNPNSRIAIYNHKDVQIFGGWVKKRFVVKEQAGVTWMTLEVDTMWQEAPRT